MWRPGPDGGTVRNATFGDGAVHGYDVLGTPRVTITPRPGHYDETLTALHHEVLDVDAVPHPSTSTIVGSIR